MAGVNHNGANILCKVGQCQYNVAHCIAKCSPPTTAPCLSGESLDTSSPSLACVHLALFHSTTVTLGVVAVVVLITDMNSVRSSAATDKNVCCSFTPHLIAQHKMRPIATYVVYLFVCLPVCLSVCVCLSVGQGDVLFCSVF